MDRVKQLLPALPSLIGAVILFVVGTCRTELACDRAAGTCAWRDGVLGGEQATFAIRDVRDVRYDGGRGKHGSDGQVTLVFASGAEKVFGKADQATAKATAERARTFFAGQGAVYRFRTPPRTFVFFLAAGSLLGGLGMITMALRTKHAALVDPVVRRKRNNQYGLFACVVVTIVVAGSIITCVTTKNPGTLVLDCQARCRFGGAECQPGSTREVTLDPGTHSVEVAAGSGWRPQPVAISEGETTTFVCP